MYKTITATLLLTSLVACSSESIKEKINKAGNIAGQATGEFVEGAAKGIEKAFDVKVAIDKALESKGIQFGKCTVCNDTVGIDNLLVVYVIFNQDFKGTLTAKAFDENALEMGRVGVALEGKKNEAKYIEFHFDKRTNIDSNNRLVIE
jgi:hypothetical protein